MGVIIPDHSVENLLGAFVVDGFFVACSGIGDDCVIVVRAEQIVQGLRIVTLNGFQLMGDRSDIPPVGSAQRHGIVPD